MNKRIIMSSIFACIIIIFGVVNLIRADGVEIKDTSLEDNKDNIVIKIPDIGPTLHTFEIVNFNIVEFANYNINVLSNSAKCIIDNYEETNFTIETQISYKPTSYKFNNISVSLTEEDLNMMCTVVSSETGYCDDKVQKAVAHTIINRINDKAFPNNIYDVVTQRNQYTAIHSYFDGQYRKDLYPGSELWNHSMELCKEALNEYDFTKGAVAYYNPHMKGYNDWFEQFELTYEDEYGRFFKV